MLRFRIRFRATCALAMHHPKAQTNTLPQPNKIRQKHIRFKLNIESLHALAFQLYGPGSGLIADVQLDVPVDVPAHALGKRQNIGAEQTFEQGNAVGGTFQLVVLAVVVGV